MAQAGPGKVRLFDDFTGPEYPVANTGAVDADTFGGQFIGPFRILGDLAETDTGVVALGVVNGAVRVSGNNEDGKGAALVTDLIFSVPLMGPLVCEARVNMQAVTTRNIFVGFCGTRADDIAPPCTSTGTAHTLTATDLIGIHIDTSLTATADWHCVYNGGTVAGQTVSTSTVSTVTAVAGEYDVLRVEIDPNGTVRYWINGNLEFTVANAATVTATDLLAAMVGCWGTTSTAADIDVDYFLVNANRDWTR